MEPNKTDIWIEYEQGITYKSQIGLYRTVDVNERIFSGDQWKGIPHEGMPTATLNFIRHGTEWKATAVSDRILKMMFSVEGESDNQDYKVYSQQISNQCDLLWERLKMRYLTKEGLVQAAVTGDYIQYFYWDSDIKTGQALTGDINTQLIDNVNYYPGNPNDPRVQKQPYIILAFREHVDSVRAEAKKNKISQEEIELIVGDTDNNYTSGDMGKIELEDNSKVTVLLKLYRKNGKIYSEKSTQNVTIQPEKSTQLDNYPIALMNWELRKNSCHGESEIKSLISNQVFVNKLLALSEIYMMFMCFPKVIYDKNRIKTWTNAVASAIPVNGDVQGAATYLSPPTASYDVWRGLQTVIDQTLTMMGATDTVMGALSNPNNTSAIIAARDAAMVPLQSQQERFYAFVEDVGMIWEDFIINFYKQGRKIPVEHEGTITYVPMEIEKIKELTLRVKIDVGPSTMWSETQIVNTLNQLVSMGLPVEIALKYYPKGYIPNVDQMIQDLNGMMQQSQQQGQQQGQQQEQQQPPPVQGGSDPKQALIKTITNASQNGEIETQVADGIIKMIQSGASDKAIREALQNASSQGLASEKFKTA